MPTPDPRIIFGKRVRELRLERRLSQEKLAELADLHRNYVGGEGRNLFDLNALEHFMKVYTGIYLKLFEKYLS